jgi:hypothetical protein
MLKDNLTAAMARTEAKKSRADRAEAELAEMKGEIIPKEEKLIYTPSLPIIVLFVNGAIILMLAGWNLYVGQPWISLLLSSMNLLLFTLGTVMSIAEKKTKTS